MDIVHYVGSRKSHMYSIGFISGDKAGTWNV
jgi:hypothetical protein